MYIVLKSVFESKCAQLLVVDLSTQSRIPPTLRLLLWDSLVLNYESLNYATSSGMHPLLNVRLHCVLIGIILYV
jgi:hypothetical protein